ncbi:cbiX family protein [Arthrobacter crystallopoietes BAB-32]|uniref:CbiX family protein n=1 Tax=Arthrobacter crystallopoietes BAB-32 TaxID=1246476 RepID=N1V5I7_9MICC|nr:CbiX/SirB N-terminal domain-containing protein [Arthrobacter crystallopoietes]EMY35264.1 cbiX family protein [Arthrobacter crystallopoietes BAB-32]
MTGLGSQLHVVACAHGTDNVSGRELIDGLRADVASALAARGLRAQLHEAYVDVQEPALDHIVAALPPGEPAVVVPLLLSTGFHTSVDIRQAVDSRPETRAARAIGPDHRLAEALARRLADVGLGEGDRVVVASAGTRVEEGLKEVRQVAEWLAVEAGRPVTVGFGAAAEPSVQAAVAAARSEPGCRRVLVAAYLLAPGYFHSQLAKAGADAVAAPLLPDPAVAECVVERLLEALNMTP